MRPIKLAFAGLFLALIALWLMADTLVPQPFGYFPFRSAFVQLTGVLAIAAMAAALVLAVRPRRLEPHLGGLDKMYRLHKWLGVSALVLSVVHWWFAAGTRWMVGWGWLERPARSGRPPGGDAEQGALEALLRGQRGIAESAGEWAFYVAVALTVVALWRRVPYHVFSVSHKLLAPVFLVLAYHALVLTKSAYWMQPIGWALALMLLLGVAAALISSAGRIGAGRKVGGVIEQLTSYPELRVIETSVRLREGWPGHRAGQFAFVKAEGRGFAHPYTMASAWNPDQRRITFITKALGDFTSRLPQELRVDMGVTVEGPYGGFTFDDGKARQIWVAGGIGVTPFIARMKHLAGHPRAQEIDFFHCTAEVSETAFAKLGADAKAAGVRLHVLISPRDGLLKGGDIRAQVPDWRSASIWFCGPPGFGAALRSDFAAHGFPRDEFHQDLFEMR